MARQRTHLILGTPAGVGIAAYLAREHSSDTVFAEALGGGLGGALGSILPDLIEPGTSSWHRSFAHSYTTAAVGLATLPKTITQWQQYCRMEADRHAHLALLAIRECDRAWHTFCAMFWRCLSGFVVGVTTGYASHLALDAASPRGLPLLA